MEDLFLKEFLVNSDVEDIDIGCSGDRVRKVTKDNNVYFVKEAKGNKLDREYVMFNYLKNCGLVPDVVYFSNCNNKSILITKKIEGDMICCDEIFDDMNHVVSLAADALKLLQNIDISTCNYYNNLYIKLAMAKHNIDNDLVTDSDMEAENLEKFGSVQNLYQYLLNNRPSEEKLCFSHGDLSIPNIYFKNDKITGFIDLGDAGIADYWYDIAILVKSLRRNYECKDAEDYLFKCLGITPDYETIEYYILLTELFL